MCQNWGRDRPRQLTAFTWKLIAPLCDLKFSSFLASIEAPIASYILKLDVREMAEKLKMCENWGRDRPWRLSSLESSYKLPHVISWISKLFSLNQNPRRLCNGTKKVGVWNSRQEKQLKKSRAVTTEEGTDQGNYLHQKAHTSFVCSHIYDFFSLNWSPHSKLCNGAKKFGFWNSKWEKWVKK
jgi:hypothetical protein